MDTNNQIVRYSDEELEEFKALILEKLHQAEQSLEMLKGRLLIDESDPTFKVLEEGANTMTKEESGQRAQRQQEYVNKLRAALHRVENKTYGVCRVTGKLIPKGRLLAVPHATTSLEGKEIEQARKQR